MMARLACVALVAILILGCAATFQTAPAGSEVAPATRIRDARPQIEREGKLLPYGRGVSANMLGDNSFQPDRLAVLEQRFLQRLGPQVQTIELKNFNVVLLLPINTPLGQMIFPNMPASVKGITDFTTTWVLIELRGSVDGTAFSSDHAEPFPKPAFGQQHETMQRALGAAIDKAIDTVSK